MTGPGLWPFTDVAWRHGKANTANFLFADGHAEALTRRALQLRNVYLDQR
jgi:prepilin-type processing-associated H-X9-DG protein